MGPTFGFSLIIFMALYTILLCVGKVFLGLAVYNDAKARNIDMAALWGGLTGFFVLIPAIIYLVLRSDNKNSIKCPRCSAQIFNGMPLCPVCQLPVTMIPSCNPEEITKRKKSAKEFLIASIILIVMGYFCFFGYFLFPILSSYGSYTCY